jgi:hypothetical protein
VLATNNGDETNDNTLARLHGRTYSVQRLSRSCIPLRRRVAVPSCCLSFVLHNKRTKSSLERDTQRILSVCKPLLRSEAKQPCSFGGVVSNAGAVVKVKVAQDVLRLGKSFTAGTTEELHRHVVIHRESVAFVVALR